jgi:16S rRNA (uracil1498-N3)-methyltransferase
VNLILFELGEFGRPLAPADPRAVHLTRVLKRGVGDPFDAGIVNGPRGKGVVVAMGREGISLRFEAGAEAPPADPIRLLLALPRPQTARKILNEAAALGVASLRFFPGEKGEAGYAQSTLWRSGEWRRHLLDGAAQAFDTRLPAVTHAQTLADALRGTPAEARIALDNYESTLRLRPEPGRPPVTLAFGPERGWSGPERDLLRASGFVLADLGPRVLRTETAVVAAVALVKAGAQVSR